MTRCVILLVGLLLTLAGATFAEEAPRRAVLLLSIESPRLALPANFPLRGLLLERAGLESIALPARLATRFRNEIRRDGRLEPVVIEHADQYALWNALRDPRNVAVIWISHAGDVIADENGFDVAPVFQTAHPGLRFLGVEGCDSARALAEVYSRFHMRRRFPNLSVHADSTLVQAEASLEAGLAAFRRSPSVTAPHAAPDEGYDPPASGARARVTRALGADSGGRLAPALRVETLDGRVLGVLPAGAGRGETSIDIELPTRDEPAADELNLVVAAGTNGGMTPERITFGELAVESAEVRGAWRVRIGPRGKPLGVTNRQMVYGGSR